MNFGDVLNDWERGKHKTSSADMAGWLDEYPPEDLDKHDKDVPHNQMEGAERRRRIRAARVQRSIDLHGLTVQEACTRLDKFLEEARRAGVRKALVIHGKGNHSRSEPVLRPNVIRYLQNHPAVGEIGEASRSEGGSGATWVEIRHRSR